MSFADSIGYLSGRKAGGQSVFDIPEVAHTLEVLLKLQQTGWTPWLKSLDQTNPADSLEMELSAYMTRCQCCPEAVADIFVACALFSKDWGAIADLAYCAPNTISRSAGIMGSDNPRYKIGRVLGYFEAMCALFGKPDLFDQQINATYEESGLWIAPHIILITHDRLAQEDSALLGRLSSAVAGFVRGPGGKSMMGHLIWVNRLVDDIATVVNGQVEIAYHFTHHSFGFRALGELTVKHYLSIDLQTQLEMWHAYCLQRDKLEE